MLRCYFSDLYLVVLGPSEAIAILFCFQSYSTLRAFVLAYDLVWKIRVYVHPEWAFCIYAYSNSEAFQLICDSSLIIRMSNLRRTRWARDVARMREERIQGFHGGARRKEVGRKN